MRAGRHFEKALGPNVRTGLSSPASANGSETRFGDDNVSATHSPTGDDAGSFTRQIPEHAVREEEVPLESMVLESPVLGSQASYELGDDELQLAGEPAKDAPVIDTSSTDAVSDEPRPRLYDLPTPNSASPSSDRGASLGESALPFNASGSDVIRSSLSPVSDYRRPGSRGLPPVREEPQEEETQAGKSLQVTTPDINRDSGVVADSPLPAWARRLNDTQQRDSGVHIRDYPDTSPRLHGSRGVSPVPSRHSRSSVEDEGARLDDTMKRSPMARAEARRRLQDETPVLEAAEPPVTPEPEKSKRGKFRSKKTYPDLGPGAGTAAAALAGGAALLAGARADAAARAPTRASSSEADKRSLSDNAADQRRAPAESPESLLSQRRAASNTGISRARTPEPLNLRPESPSLLRHSATPPLRSRRTRSGDLRTLSQSSQASHSDLGARGSPSPAPVGSSSSTNRNRAAAPASAPIPATAANNNTPAPASSSSSSSDLRRATTSASAPATALPAHSSKSPVANEGRVRTKDMADVYVSDMSPLY